nr:MAG TPA: hypothetical protein [Caudoviricetes sp.]
MLIFSQILGTGFVYARETVTLFIFLHNLL